MPVVVLHFRDLENIYNFACLFFHCVASIASIECLFSNFSFIQNNLGLALKTVTKLVMAYKMQNSKNKNLGPEAFENC